METKLFNSELKIMEVIWKCGDIKAKDIAKILNKEVGWNVNTVYTLINRCIKKKAILRVEPGFVCHALISKKEVQESETRELINKIYDGSEEKLFAALLSRNTLSKEQIEQLKHIVDSLENEVDVVESVTSKY